MKSIHVSRVLPAPLEEAFAACTDLEHAAERIRGIERIEVLGDAPVGLGTRWRETRLFRGREATEEMEITNWAPPKGYTVEADSHGTHYVTAFTFEAESPEATRVSLSFAAEPRTLVARVLGWLFGTLFKGMTEAVRQCLVDDLDDLASWLQARRSA